MRRRELLKTVGASLATAMLPAAPPAPYDLYLQALIGSEFTNLFILEVREWR